MKLTHLLICPLLFCLVACGRGNSKQEGALAQQDSLPLMVMQIQKCSRLYTSEYQLHKIVTFQDTLSLSGRFLHQPFKINIPGSRRRIAIPVEATVKASVNMSKLTAANVHRHGKKIEIILPDPEITLTSTKIDHEGVRQKVALFNHKFTDEEVTAIQRQGRDDIIKSIPKLNITENARENAARQLIPLIRQMGYDEKDITVTFRKEFTIGDLPKLIKNID
jgi:hypothetical protein